MAPLIIVVVFAAVLASAAISASLPEGTHVRSGTPISHFRGLRYNSARRRHVYTNAEQRGLVPPPLARAASDGQRIASLADNVVAQPGVWLIDEDPDVLAIECDPVSMGMVFKVTDGERVRSKALESVFVVGSHEWGCCGEHGAAAQFYRDVRGSVVSLDSEAGTLTISPARRVARTDMAESVGLFKSHKHVSIQGTSLTVASTAAPTAAPTPVEIEEESAGSGAGIGLNEIILTAVIVICIGVTVVAVLGAIVVECRKRDARARQFAAETPPKKLELRYPSHITVRSQDIILGDFDDHNRSYRSALTVVASKL